MILNNIALFGIGSSFQTLIHAKLYVGKSIGKETRETERSRRLKGFNP